MRARARASSLGSGPAHPACCPASGGCRLAVECEATDATHCVCKLKREWAACKAQAGPMGPRQRAAGRCTTAAVWTHTWLAAGPLAGVIVGGIMWVLLRRVVPLSALRLRRVLALCIACCCYGCEGCPWHDRRRRGVPRSAHRPNRVPRVKVRRQRCMRPATSPCRTRQASRRAPSMRTARRRRPDRPAGTEPALHASGRRRRKANGCDVCTLRAQPGVRRVRWVFHG